MKILLVAGHSSRSILNPFPDQGAVLREQGKLITTENREAKTIVSRASVILNEKYGDDRVRVCPFRYNLRQKIKWANKFTPYDILISLHLNASNDRTVEGSEIWYYGGSPNSEELAMDLAEKQSKVLRNRNRGAKPDTNNRHGRLGIIRDTKPWAFLTEMAFISNTKDLAKARNHGTEALIRLVDTIKRY